VAALAHLSMIKQLKLFEHDFTINIPTRKNHVISLNWCNAGCRVRGNKFIDESTPFC
jgi:hypothetical protein